MYCLLWTKHLSENAWSKGIGNDKSTRGTCWSEKRDIPSKKEDPTENHIFSFIISISISDTITTFIKITKATESSHISAVKYTVGGEETPPQSKQTLQQHIVFSFIEVA